MMIPINTTLPTWAASLIIDFPQENIPLLYNEDQWRKWGNFIVQEGVFAQNGAPNTSLFDGWLPWAQAVFKTMANY